MGYTILGEMKEKIGKFLSILKIELEDLEQDLVSLEDSYRQKWEEDKISNYVFLENMAVLREELTGIHKILGDLTTVNSSSFSNIDEFIEHILTIIKENRKNIDLPEGVYRLLRRKIMKVRNFILE